MTLLIDSTVQAQPDHLSSELGGEAVILDLKGGTYFGMNEVGARIWALIESPVSVSAVVRQIMDEFDVDQARCEASVLRFLTRLRAEGLIQILGGNDEGGGRSTGEETILGA